MSNSPTAKAFDAKVNITLGDQSAKYNFLVVAASPTINLAGIVRAHGGQVWLEHGPWVLARLSFSESQHVRCRAGVLFVGGISLDPERFAAVMKLWGPSTQ